MVEIFEAYVDGSCWKKEESSLGRMCYYIPKMNIVSVWEEKVVSHNEAEYRAIEKLLKDYSENNFIIYSDSKVTVEQLNYNFFLKNDLLREYALRIWGLTKGRNVKFEWVPRKENKAGKVLG